MLFREHDAPPLPGSNDDESQNPDTDSAETTPATSVEESDPVTRAPSADNDQEQETTMPADQADPADDMDDDNEVDDPTEPYIVIRNGGSNRGISSGAVIGMSVGLSACLVALIGAIYLMAKHRRIQQRKLWDHEEAFAERMRGDVPPRGNQRLSFPLKFPRFLPGVNQSPRDYRWRETRRRGNELPPDIIHENRAYRDNY